MILELTVDDIVCPATGFTGEDYIASEFTQETEYPHECIEDILPDNWGLL